MSDVVLDRRTRREIRREGRQGTALFVSTVILTVVALGSAAAAVVVRHDTDQLRSRAEPIQREVRALTTRDTHAERRLRVLQASARATTRALTDLFAAEQAQVDASNHAVDVANQAVDQFNSGQTADVGGAFAAAGDAAIADLEQKTAAVRTATDAVQRAVTSLREIAGG